MAKIKPAAVVPKRPGFWTTLPGILTGLAAAIGAITTLVVALKKEPEKPAVGVPSASPTESVTATNSASAAKSPVAPAPGLTSVAPSQTATVGNGGNAINVSGGGNQVRVGK